MIISGVKVSFPEGKKPFPQQIGVMQKIIASASQNQNALLESPTGTGKTLALLCSTLSWQKKQYESDCKHYLASAAAASAAAATAPAPAMTTPAPVKRSRHFGQEEEDDLFEDDQFVQHIREATTAATTAPQNALPAMPLIQPKPVKIFYSSRTHTQLSQVVAELKRCPPELLAGPGGSGGLKISVLGSREQYCVNPKVYKEKGVSKNDACNALVKENKCAYFPSANNLAKHIGSQIMDIEDLVTMGKKELGCPFFAAKRAMGDAHIVFLPYNYLMDPSIRASSGLGDQIRGSIVVFDEAHNVEDVSREAASIEIGLEAIKAINLQLEAIGREVLEMSKASDEISNLISALAGWAHGRPAATSDNGLSPNNQVVLEGPEAIASIYQQQGISITPQTLAEYRVHLQQLKSKEEDSQDAQVSSSTPGGKRKLTSLPTGTVSQLESLLYCLEFLVADEFRYARDFRVATITKWNASAQRAPGSGGHHHQQTRGQHELYLCIWCLNPAVAFRALAETTRSLVLTSGTLSPLRAFAAELGVEFKHTLEANHVCDINKQLVALGVQRMNRELLDCTYKNAERLDFQSAIGEAILCVARVTPGGMLVFFPSYALLERCTNRWRQVGMWDEMEQVKPISVETRGGSEEFDKAVAKYRALCQNNAGGGGMFFAVFRGKLSEGIDFRDEQARAVVIVGIPFPNTKDLVVGLKKQHQDQAKRRAQGASVQPLTGQEWYNQQAYRALNQALGRVIRHRNDYGAIVLLDHRFQDPRVVENLSKWMRNAVRLTPDLSETPGMMVDFFQRLSLQGGAQHPPLASTTTPSTPAAAAAITTTPLRTLQHLPTSSEMQARRRAQELVDLSQDDSD